jgi:hypothetical protein
VFQAAFSCLRFACYYRDVKIVTTSMELNGVAGNGGLRAPFLAVRMAAVKFSDHVIADNIAINRYIQSQYRRSSHFIAYGGEGPTRSHGR